MIDGDQYESEDFEKTLKPLPRVDENLKIVGEKLLQGWTMMG